MAPILWGDYFLRSVGSYEVTLTLTGGPAKVEVWNDATNRKLAVASKDDSGAATVKLAVRITKSDPARSSKVNGGTALFKIDAVQAMPGQLPGAKGVRNLHQTREGAVGRRESISCEIIQQCRVAELEIAAIDVD